MYTRHWSLLNNKHFLHTNVLDLQLFVRISVDDDARSNDYRKQTKQLNRDSSIRPWIAFQIKWRRRKFFKESKARFEITDPFCVSVVSSSDGLLWRLYCRHRTCNNLRSAKAPPTRTKTGIFRFRGHSSRLDIPSIEWECEMNDYLERRSYRRWS